jgi:hypothetical protein
MKFEIWREGYATNGQRSGEALMRTVEADTFQEACIKAFEGDDYFRFIGGKPCHWGCELFPTQEEAHKKWGDTWRLK